LEQRSRGPDFAFLEAERGEIHGPQGRILGHEILVELGRWLGRAGQHGVGLAAVMDLVLEEVEENPVRPFHLDVPRTMDS
jgi:hypothetical protein